MADDRKLCLASAGNKLAYDRSKVTPGIVHLGVGAFYRAHVAEYVDKILANDPSWGIIGASLQRPDTRNALAPQDFIYTLASKSADNMQTRFIGSILDVLDAGTQKKELLAALADPRIRIVTLTITEKGYCHKPTTGEIDSDHPDIKYDLANPEDPITALGILVRAIELRKEAGHLPFTVLCCDNLPANGVTARRVVVGMAALRDAALASYISQHIAFPSTMVDRIVPATNDDDRKLVAQETGLVDAWPVVTEPFTQWVIEDRFSSGRPRFEDVGAELVADVEPYEKMKLRMLNGSHSTLAYLGYLAGFTYVSEAIACQPLRRLVYDLMSEEVMPTLPKGLADFDKYRDKLIERFTNPALKHRTWQIAMDGTQKLPQRLLGTIRDLLSKGLPISRASLGVAAWMRYITAVDENGKPIDVKDPHSIRLKSIADAAHGDAAALVEGLLSFREVFDSELAGQEVFRNILVRHVESLLRLGSLKTAQALTD